jgi:photosystem II stability/assembly factor-like uncharacterized protein
MKSTLRFNLRLPLRLGLAVILLLAPLAAHAAATFNNWTSSGPFPAPSKAVIKALAIAPTTPVATIYNGSDGGGIYTMAEGGSSWSAVNSGLKNREVQGVAVHPLDPAVLYAATKGGVFKTSDAGISWNELSTGLTSKDVRGVAINPQAPATVYAATGAGVSKSVNGGTNWADASSGLTSLNVRAVLIDPASPSLLYAATNAGVFQSSDSGATWTPVNTGLGNTDVLSLAYAATTPATLLAGTNGAGVFLSTDGGANWSADNPGGSLPNLAVHAILVDNPSAPTLAYVGTGNGLYKQQYTLGVWNNWVAASSGMATPAPAIHAIANNPVTRATVYAGTDLGSYRSSNSAGAWSALSTGLRQGRALAVKPTDPTVMVAGFGAGGIYRSSDTGGNWIATIDDAATKLFVTALLYDTSGSTVFAASGSGVFRSVDDGATWTDISAGLANTDVRCLALGPGSTLHAGTAQGIFVWDGATWTGYGAGQPTNADLTSLAFKGSSLFAGTNGGGVFRSDGGGPWSQVISGLSNTVVSSLAVDASNVYLGTAAGVYRSADNGNSWNAVNSGITNLAIKSLAVSTGTAAFITAGTNGGGVFFSTNGGDVWAPMNNGLSDLTVNALSASATTKKVFAATAGARIFSLNAGPICTVTPAAPLAANPVDFGRINVSSSKSTIFTVQNTGTLQLTVSSFALAGTDSPRFAMVPGGSRNCDLTALPVLHIEAGDFCTIGVNFTPIASGDRTASLAIYSDAPNQPVTAYLLGKGGFPPQATITSPATGAVIRNPALISGTAIDKIQSSGADGTGSTLSKVEISTDGGVSWHDATKSPTLNSWTQWSYSWTGSPLPANGSYLIKARATDSNGFVQSALSSLAISLDNTPPVTTITAKPVLLDKSVSGSFGFSVDKAGSSSQCQIDSGAWLSCASPFSYGPLADGSHSFNVKSTDPIGNPETVAKSYAWAIDSTAPAVSISAAPALFTQSSDASFTFSANEAGCSFSCSIDGVASTCTSPKSYTNLPDGHHSFTVRATDPAGNTAAITPAGQSYSWTVDKSDKPGSTLDAPLAPLSGASYLFSGTASDAVSGVNSVIFSVNNLNATPASDAAVSPAQSWSSWRYLWSLPVNGSYTVQVVATDNAGNPQLNPASASVIVANPVPVIQLGSPAASSLLGASAPRFITGTAQAAAGGLSLQKVQIAVFPAATPPATRSWIDVNGTTSWSYSWQFPADGVYTIEARALDMAASLSGAVVGNASQVASRNVTIDTTPPTSAITPLSNPYLTGASFSLAGTADDPAAGTGVQQVSVSVMNDAGQTTTGAANYNSQAKTWSYTSGTLPDGAYTVRVTATDNAGNQQANPATTTITIDNLPPVSTITGKPVPISRLSATSFSFTATEAATFTCTLDGLSAPCVCTNATASSCTQSYSGLVNGAHSFSVRAKDRAGNVETAAKSYSWNIDLIHPSVTRTTPTDGTTRLSAAATTVKAVFSEDLDPATVNAATFRLDHGASGVVTYDPATRTATFTPSASLAYTTTYTATLSTGIADLAGNPLSADYSWTFNTAPDGDVNLDGKVDISDALLCLQMAVGSVTPTAQQLRQGDVAPFKDGTPFSDGKLDASDALIILSRVIGTIHW